MYLTQSQEVQALALHPSIASAHSRRNSNLGVNLHDEEWLDLVQQLYKSTGGEQNEWQGEVVLMTFRTTGLRESDLTPRPELFEVWRTMRIAKDMYYV